MLVKNPRQFQVRTRQFIASTYVRGTSALPTYAEWLSDHLLARAHDYPIPLNPIRFSILTTVYEKTDVNFLRETAKSIFAQTLPFHEWMILAHGSVSDGVDKLLRDVERRPNVRVHRLPQNLGIMGGMRFCLERASGDYIVPMDADDLLTEDALQIMAAAIAWAENPAILYSDEDILMDGALTTPYLRPDWDPILNLANSYIWHLCVFRRDTAIELEVYTDMGSNWCHDWDTIFRLANAGYIPLHIPEVLYHWRHHAASSTNRADPESGSLKSTRHLLERQIALQPNPEHYEVEAFPIFRGTQEWHIKRRPYDGRAMDIILVARNIERALGTVRSILRNTNYPFGSVIVCINEEPNDRLRTQFEMCIEDAFSNKSVTSGKTSIQFVADKGLGGVKVAVSKATSPLTLFCTDAIEVKDENWSWEALKLIEFHHDIAMIGGRLLVGNIIVDGGGVFGERGLPVCLDKGLSADAIGPFALSLKPHTVNAVPLDFFVARHEFLTSAINSLPDAASISCLSMWLGGVAVEQKSRVAFTPLINVSVKGDILGTTCKNNKNELEHEAFLLQYGHMIKKQQWSSSRFAMYKEIYQSC